VRRREFIVGLGAAAAWPVASQAQQPPTPVIGLLHGISEAQGADRIAAFRRSLAGTGFVDGRSILTEYRWAEGHVERLPALASDLIARRVAVLVVGASDVGIRAAMSATKMIPIVFHTASDPVDAGFVESFSRPGGNVTGVAALGAEISGKRLELLHRAVPTATIVGLLVNPNNPRLAKDAIERSKAAARQLGVQIQVMNAANSDEIDSAMASAAQARVDALAISNDAYLSARSQQVAYLALHYRLPTIGFTRQDAQAGVLISFGSNFADNYRLIGGYVARILMGDKVAELPVIQPTRFELVVNMLTAKTLGLKIPELLLGTADEVIQ
jgi:putative tryptophan/tyrosine transport system substrate-binding protein